MFVEGKALSTVLSRTRKDHGGPLAQLMPSSQRRPQDSTVNTRAAAGASPPPPTVPRALFASYGQYVYANWQSAHAEPLGVESRGITEERIFAAIAGGIAEAPVRFGYDLALRCFVYVVNASCSRERSA